MKNVLVLVCIIGFLVGTTAVAKIIYPSGGKIEGAGVPQEIYIPLQESREVCITAKSTEGRLLLSPSKGWESVPSYNWLSSNQRAGVIHFKAQVGKQVFALSISQLVLWSHFLFQ